MAEDTDYLDGEELRAKYNQADRDKMAGKEAMADGSYPIADAEDLGNAIRAVGRGSNNSHNAIRKHIMARAKSLGLSKEIPDTWNADGSLAEANAAEVAERRAMKECPTCDGSGKIKGGSTDCPDCDGTGEVERAADSGLEHRRLIAERLDGAIENRRFAVSGLELRDTSDGGLRFTGYASITEHPYEVGDFTETIARGAFKRTLQEGPDVVLLVNHEGMPLARTKSGTMSLAEDARGLRVDADLDPSDPDVQRLLPKMRRNDIDQMSFAFRVTDQDWSDDYSTRLIRSLGIHRGDVSIVTYGANEATTSNVTMRSADGLLEVRAGKAISAANKAEIQGAIDKLAAMLDPESAEEPVDEAVIEPPLMRSQPPDFTTRARQEYDLMIARNA